MGLLTKIFGAKAPEVTEDIEVYTDILDRGRDNVNSFYISGVAHHCTRKDIGFFTGMVYNQKDNTYNPKAMAVASHQTSKIVGYVPESILDSYRRWCKDKCVCVGYIYFNGEHLLGRGRAYKPGLNQDLMMKDIADYAKQVCEHFGWPVPSFETE